MARARAARTIVKRTRVHALVQPGSFNLTTAWTPLGPAQTLTPAFGKVTGRVTSIAVDGSDTKGNTVYLGTTGGGVWGSTNAAGPSAQVTFTQLTDQVPAVNPPGISGISSLSIGAVSVQPGGTGVVLVGTGDPNDALDSYYGEGILRSADHGVTWTTIDEADKPGTSVGTSHSFVGEGFAGFAWSTVNTGLVVAAVTQAFDGVVVNALQPNSFEGLYYSNDAGVSWHLATITDGPEMTVQGTASMQAPAIGGVGVYDGNAATAVVWNPARQMFYVAIRYHGYYGSPDGVMWTRLPDANQPGSAMTIGTSMLPGNCPTNPGTTGAVSCPVFRGALAVQPITGDMFAFTVDQNDLDQGIYWDQCTANSSGCTTGASATFSKSLGDSVLETMEGDQAVIPQGDYDLWLAAVPSAGGTLLYAGTEDIFKCSLSTPAAECAWQNTSNVNSCAAPSIAGSQHAVGVGLLAGPEMFFGNDSGLWRTMDGIVQASLCSADFENLNGGLGSLAEVTSIAEDPDNSGTLMAAQGVNGTSATTTATTATPGAWPQVLDGFGEYVAIDPADTLNWYASSGYGVSVYLCGDGGACDAAPFPALLVGDAQTDSDGETLEEPAVWMLDPQDSSTMIVGTCRVWRGSIADGSANWTTANALSAVLNDQSDPSCNGEGQIRSLGASGTLPTPAGTTQEILYAGMAGTFDGGQTAAGHVYTTSVSAGATGASTWPDLYTSTVVNDTENEGQFNPGGFAISSVVVDTHDTSGQTVYATVQGISNGALPEPSVYASANGGQSWTNITANLPEAPVNGLAVDPGDAQIVYVATDVGVYATTSVATVATCSEGQLQCWSALGTAMPDVPVTAVAAWGTGTAGILRAATYGRGVWQIPLLSTQPLAKGTPPPGATDTLSPTSLQFKPQIVGTVSTAQLVTISNTGSAALTSITVSTTGDFAATDSRCQTNVPGGASCAVSVTFVPTTPGAETGTLTITDALRSQTVPLSGTGVAPAGVASVGPTLLNFGEEGVGVASASRSVTVTNYGNTPLTGMRFTITGDFQLVPGSCGGTLTTGATCTEALTFLPTTTGPLTGTLTLTGDGAGQSYTTPLTGEGIAFTMALASAASVTIVSGKAATYMVNITPTGASAGTLNLTCTGAPAGYACTASGGITTGTVTLANGNPSSVTVTAAPPTSANVHRGAAPGSRGSWGIAGVGGTILACAVPFWFRRRRSWTALAAVLLVTMGGCGVGATGGSGGGGGGGGGGGTGTSPSYTLVLTASAPGVKQSVSMTLVVEQ
jgi:hypothetical protein